MDIVGIGTPCFDFIVRVRELPKGNDSMRMQDYTYQGGGIAATALVAASRLGAKTGLVGITGSDNYGRFIIDDFIYNGVDTSHIKIQPDGVSPFSVVVSEDKSQGRNIMYNPGTIPRLTVDDLDKEYITSGKFLHLEWATPVSRQAAVWAREKGVKVVMDVTSYYPEVEDMTPLIDVFVASENYYNKAFNTGTFEENCRKIREKGPEIVVFTFGGKGCVGLGNEGYFEIPAFKVNVADTTGAGDVYHGAFIYGLLQGWNASDTARFASAVSAVKCTRMGGRAGIPDLKTVREFIETGDIDYSEIDKRVEYKRKGVINV